MRSIIVSPAKGRPEIGPDLLALYTCRTRSCGRFDILSQQAFGRRIGAYAPVSLSKFLPVQPPEDGLNAADLSQSDAGDRQRACEFFDWRLSADRERPATMAGASRLKHSQRLPRCRSGC